MSIPEAILLTSDPLSLVHHASHPFALALLPGSVDLGDGGARGLWLVDADCGMATLNDPAFTAYLAGGVPITVHAEKLRDLRPFLRRKAEFRRRGYRVEVVAVRTA